MLISIGQGGNQLAACVWNRAQQQQIQMDKTDREKRARRANPYHAATATSSAAVASAAALSSPPLPVIPRSPWFALDGHAHAIIVDAEPKVVAQMQEMGKEMHAASSSSSGGDKRGAMGYFGREGTEGTPGSLLSSTLDSVRLEFERLESGAGGDLILMHSLSGGTGSGLGSRLGEELRESYPKNFMASVSIAPFGQGDTPLQHYNSLLCLHRIYQSMDGVVLGSNADVSRAIESLKNQRNAAGAGAASMASSATPAGNMAFAGINTYLSAAFADVFGPTRFLPTLKAQEDAERARMYPAAAKSSSVSVTPTTSGLLASQPLYELLSHAAPLPSFKLLEIWSSAGLAGRDSAASFAGDGRAPPNPSWKACLESLQRFVPREAVAAAEGDHDDAIGRTLAYTLYARGDSTLDPVSACYSSLESRLAKLLPPAVDWNPYPLDLVPSDLPRMVMGRGGGSMESPRGLGLCINRSRTSLTLRPVVRKARTLLANKAYTHWYTRYGLEVDEMKQAFDAVEDLIETYQTV